MADYQANIVPELPISAGEGGWGVRFLPLDKKEAENQTIFSHSEYLVLLLWAYSPSAKILVICPKWLILTLVNFNKFEIDETRIIFLRV